MGIEPTEDASQRPPPVLKTGPVTRSGSATAAECNSFRSAVQRERPSAQQKRNGSGRMSVPTDGTKYLAARRVPERPESTAAHDDDLACVWTCIARECSGPPARRRLLKRSAI